ncbi:glycosylphosphatidylinositol anchor biosynthesis [Coemansia aciculifera]|uniref:Mannosyltransferase n=1 Tax=Coemansia aciculifera TaxID=417176 RepID=A0A9W8M7N4_9FUNG|nr:glycosylphosphatidylinositol anchor biosynthesis [Coemansia aciculifera]
MKPRDSFRHASMGFVQRHLFASLLALRLANVALVQTYIHPDETWQSLEVAHRTVFSYGFVTWEWQHALRGFAHPMLFAAVYAVLQALRLDDTFLLTAPYVLVALIAATADYATFHFAKRVAGSQVANWAVLCSAVSWSMGSGVVRPLVNSAETALTAAAFVYWPWDRAIPNFSLLVALVFAAFSCVIRPTSAALWLCAGLVLLFTQPRSHCIARTLYIVKCTLMVGIPAIASMLVIDRLGYKRWVFPPYQFYLFNVHEGLATWFGESPPLYHLYVSMPILFTSMLPFVLHGAYIAIARGYATAQPAVVAVAAMFVFSLVGHMEYRFLYPLLPIGFMYAAVSINSLVGTLPSLETGRRSSRDATAGAKPKRWRLWSVRNIVVYLLVTNVPASLYFNLVHQRGVVDVMAYLRSEAQDRLVEDIGFLMPCHSTPYYSHLHQPIPMWFLSCEPPLEKSELATHYCEADDFELDPVGFMHRVFDNSKSSVYGALDVVNLRYKPGQTRRKPSHLVFYECMAKRIHSELTLLGYSECARFFNTHFNGDARRKGDVVVYCRPLTAAK